MSRRPVNLSRRHGDSGGGGAAGLFSFNSKSRSAPYFPILLILLGSLLILAYLYRDSGGRSGNIGVFNHIEGDFSCTAEVQRAMSVLKKAYGGRMHKVLHVGPGTCSVVSNLRKEEETEAWGVEPYDMEDVDSSCRALVRKGIVRVADIKFPLPYRPKSFSLVIVSDALDYLSPRYLNKTLPDLARVSSDGLVIFTGFPGQHTAKAAEVSKFGRAAKLRSSSWWARYFIQTSLEENEAALKKFEQAAAKMHYNPNCQIFHLKAYT
ncbi:probable pectin methylesterase CGR3 isoform X2 [Euphorbia lathyris]|uniref:probable pectin methylesterase CGR3 isoform X2 n=1 Tax=Euphorbia lathyris TaxID=212925 RepID=UPI0033136074